MALLRSRKLDSVLTLLKNANLALAFLLELCALVALGYWGLQSGQGMIAKIGLAIGAPVVAVVIWALFGAPKAVWPLVGPWHLIVDVVFFGGAAVALFARRAAAACCGIRAGRGDQPYPGVRVGAVISNGGPALPQFPDFRPDSGSPSRI